MPTTSKRVKPRPPAKAATAPTATAVAAGEVARFATLEIPVSIAAPIDRVWAALVSETYAWWKGNFVTTGPGARFVIEPRVGGRMFEDQGDGRGLLWATVLRVDPLRCLEFAGDIFPEWGGPVRTQVSIRLTAEGAATKLVLRDALVGNVTASHLGALDRGWKLLIGRMFKEYVESHPTP